LNSLITAKVTKNSENSKLGEILKNVEKGWNKRTKIITFTDKISQYFISMILLISASTFIFFALQGRYEEAFIRTLTLIIITCPCALGLATPLSLTLTLSRLANNGILVKDQTVIEKVSKIKNIFFDKTGTLTNGSFKVTEWIAYKKDHFYDEIYNLELKSSHPIANSLKKYIAHKTDQDIAELNLANYQEVIGEGPRAEINGNNYKISPLVNSELAATAVGLYRNEELVVKIILADTVKTDATKTLNIIRSLKLETLLISGDNEKLVKEIGKELNFSEENIFGSIRPKDKSAIISKYPNTMMLGDGANDAIALSNSDVGVAVHGSVDISLRASTVFFTTNNLDNVPRLIIISKETIKLIKRNLVFSLSYNIIGCFLAINGNITPLLAAILMPISSFTVLLSTLWGTSALRAQAKKL
jgi:Cu2+-exporting ATPase/Cu+-exporting ATPase